MRGKKRKVLRFEESKAKKKTSKEDLEKKKADAEEQEAALLTQIVEDGPSQIHTLTPRPLVSINLTADYLTRYFVTPFVTLEEVGKKFYKNFTPGPDHLNTMNELIRRSKDYEETSAKIFKANQRAIEAKEDQKEADERVIQLEKEKTNLEARVKELKEKMEIISKEKTASIEDGKKKDKKIKNLQVQWIDCQEVEDKEVILGNLQGTPAGEPTARFQPPSEWVDKAYWWMFPRVHDACLNSAILYHSKKTAAPHHRRLPKNPSYPCRESDPGRKKSYTDAGKTLGLAKTLG
ncbi:hypothetical protein R1sor_021135 [Riccia sorocarpa]|uniref:Uncharacterized protein n=1 Tax=Riccia sorocarpa TaxID=122646 RepID=A0ABD3GIA8_9MARC